ncbi:MAG: hypothetical protein HON65_10480 [Rhodospirillales bacterium]|jgi:hypothetical protein|nr:hypothetical protein [Rhodospirillales bacterium]
MQINYDVPEEFQELLNAELGKAAGAMELSGDRSAMGIRAIDVLGNDISLDDSILDLDEIY